jgi:hypothetical protein
MLAQNESPEQIEDEIRDTRRDIDRTLDALQSKISPGQLLDQALSYVKDGGGEFTANFGRSISRNPVPVALLGIGLTWIMCSGQGTAPDGGDESRTARRSPNGGNGTDEPTRDDRNYYSDSSSAGVGEAVERGKGRVNEGIHDARDTAAGYAAAVSGAASDMADRVRGSFHGARETATGYAQSASDAAGDMADRAGAYAQRAWDQGVRAKDGAARMLEDYPVLVGVLGLAAGAIAAALLPRTQREDELMGQAADDLKRSAKDTLQGAADDVAEAVQDVGDEASRAEAGAQPSPQQSDGR